jgi:acid phosphatase type 7
MACGILFLLAAEMGWMKNFHFKKVAQVFLFLLVTGCTTNAPTPEFKPSVERIVSKNVLHTLLIAGDIADCRNKTPAQSNAAKTAAQLEILLRDTPNASIITLGDHVYENGTALEYSDCYTPTWGRFKEKTFPAPGNHDYHTPLAEGYYDYFGARAGPARRGYYSFDVAGWHVISLNSNIADDNGAEQIKWLREDLAANKANCTIAYWHHPLFTSSLRGNNSMMKTAWKILHEADADIVLSAHDHHYERFVPQDAEGNANVTRGVREFLVGTGGANLSPVTDPPRQNSEVQITRTFGVMRLDLQEGQYTWEFAPSTASDASDSGTGVCH